MVCPLCFEAMGANAVHTVCSHAFCRTCLSTWTASNGTCPMCRHDLGLMRVGVQSEVRVAAASIRDRIEAEHHAREQARSRMRQVHDRIDSYRSAIFTPSGRPFETLPSVSLDEMRNMLRENRNALARETATVLH